MNNGVRYQLDTFSAVRFCNDMKNFKTHSFIPYPAAFSCNAHINISNTYLNYRATHGNMHGIGDAGDSRSPAAAEREESKEPRRRNNPISHRREASEATARPPPSKCQHESDGKMCSSPKMNECASASVCNISMSLGELRILIGDF